MTTLLNEALTLLSKRINLSTGLDHPLDDDAAKELFQLLDAEGEVLLQSEIMNWAINYGWSIDSANALGTLAQRIGEGKRVRIINRNRWKPDIIDILKTRIG